MEENTKLKIVKKQLKGCGVPHCRSCRTDKISVHRIPAKVLRNPKELLKWKIALGLNLEKPLPKHFSICSLHFEENKILIPISRGQKIKRPHLLETAFPTKNLPNARDKVTNQRKDSKIQSVPINEVMEISITEETTLADANVSVQVRTEACTQTNTEYTSIGIQATTIHVSKCFQVGDDLHLNTLPYNIDSDYKLNTTTGIPTLELLDTIVKKCQAVRKHDKAGMSLKFRIILTMHRIKQNVPNAMIAIIFNLAQKTTSKYFADTIQLLAKALGPSIVWLTKGETPKILPACFEMFPNTVSVLNSMEIKTEYLRNVTKDCSTFSRYKGIDIIKLLVGVAPSGYINFTCTAAGKVSDKIVFNLTQLANLMKPGDAIMVDKDFLTPNELLRTGVELIRPQTIHSVKDQTIVKKELLKAAARIHIRRRITRIRTFRMLTERVSVANLPYIDDIITVVCAISNLSLPILSDDIHKT